MEETPVIQTEPVPTAPDAPAESELAALARRLADQLETARQAQDAREESIREREAALRTQELAALARRMLREKELPEELADCLTFADEAAVKCGVDAIEEAFRAAVQQGVEARLQSAAPKTGEIKPIDQLTDEEYYAAVCRND